MSEFTRSRTDAFAYLAVALTTCAACTHHGADSGAVADSGSPSATQGGSRNDASVFGSGGSIGSGGHVASGGQVGSGGQSGSGGGTNGSGGRDASAGAAGEGGSAPAREGSTFVQNRCIEAGTCPPNTWTAITVPHVDLTDPLSCDNIGTESIQVNPTHPEELYTLFTCQGIWRTRDYGDTWEGPINTGMNGDQIGDCAGGITIPPHDTADAPTLYSGCIRGAGTGFMRSTNGGVDWEKFAVDVAGSNNQFYPPAVDPYDPKHVLISGHGVPVLAESIDGGETWTAVPLDAAMQPGATGGINFIDTGNAATTRTTWLWLAQPTGGVGTWRTTNGGANASWTRVSTNEHPAGVSQIFQPDTSGVVYMGGLYATEGFGGFRSIDYGVTWTHFGSTTLEERVIFATKKHVFVMMGNEAQGVGTDPALQVADQPGTGPWTMPATPASLMEGPFEAAVTTDGSNSIVITANWSTGLWRYIEPN